MLDCKPQGPKQVAEVQTMERLRKLAILIDKHMQLLADHNVTEPPVIINRMVGHLPDLHAIWTEATDDQLLALMQQFPGFSIYARIMEDATAAEDEKASRPYDGLAPLPEPNIKTAEHLLRTAAEIERGFMELQHDRLKIFRRGYQDLHVRHRQWQAAVTAFKSVLRADGVEERGMRYIDTVFEQLDARIVVAAG